MIIDSIIVLILLAIIGGACFYVRRAKKQGAGCIGCPHAKECKSTSCQCGIPRNGETK